MAIEAVLFDFDGTLTEPGTLDFAAIRSEIGCPQGQPILEFIGGLPGDRSTLAASILDRFEMEAASRSRPNAGAEELLHFLASRKFKIGIISRNSAAAIRRALANFAQVRACDFDLIISRDDPCLPKPSPDAVMFAARRLGVPAGSILVAGDFSYDIEAGKRAGARTAYLTNGGASPPCPAAPDYTVAHLWELRRIMELAGPLPAGKLPNSLLAEFLDGLETDREALLIAPGIGEDVAAVEIENEEILVLKSDPVTFATDAIARYAVAVNMNDVATSGAVPRWLLTTLLFPVGTAAEDVLALMRELQSLCGQHGLILCGGHTEITDAVTRPVVIAQAAGTVARRHLVDKRAMRAGDRVLLTKGIALEGTCLIAREFAGRLRRLGMPERDIGRCRAYLDSPGISVVKEAALAAASGRVTAMHDVTEGGLATALEELSMAGGRRLRVFSARIPILPDTARVCSLLGLNPLGLIGSGSLVICCPAEASDLLVNSIRAAGIEAAVIGEVLEKGKGVEAVDQDGKETPWPRFETDELARLFSLPDTHQS